MARWIILAAAFIALGVRPLAAAAPVNDSFAGQPVLFGGTNTINASNIDATGEAGEPSHAGNPASASLWWTWIAPDNGPVVVDTLGSTFDTVLAVYTGDALNALTLVDANDDAPGLPTSLLAFPAIRGTTYRIVVDGYLGASGDVHLRLHLPVEPSAPRITNQPASQTVPDNTDGDVTFSVAATGSFPLVFDWQKDGVSLPGGTNASHTITNATLAAAGDYRVVITNSSGSITSSVATLNVLATLGQDMFAGRVVITGQTNTVLGHNFGATTETDEPLHAGLPSGASLWWSWTAPQNGLVQLDTTGSSDPSDGVLDTLLAVYIGASVNLLTTVAANNDEIFGLLVTSKVFFRAVAGVTYHIAVAGALDTNGAAATGDIALHLAQSPDNDFFSQALTFPSDQNRVHDNNVGATIETGEPSHPGNVGGKSVWWSWVAPGSGTYVLDTVGSAIDTVLGVYTGTSLATLTVVGVDDNRSDDGASLVKFHAVAGTTYHFAVDGFDGINGASEGGIVLNLNQSLVPNDDFSERVTLSGQTNEVTASNVAASKEPGEPDHGGNAGGRSLWWTWTAHLTGPVLVSTRDSDFDTALAVYAGTQLSSLTLIGENDDTDPVNPAAGSVVLFEGIAGQTYQIAVDGYRFGDGTVASGTAVLRLVQPAVPAPGGNDLFVNRYPITGQTNAAFGVNTNASVEAGEPSHAGNDGGRSIWWSWVAPATSPVRFDTIGSGFDTTLAVYQGSSVGSLSLVAADLRGAGEGRSLVTFEAVEGVEYQVAVDGFNNGSGAASGQVILVVRQFDPGALHANDDFDHASPIAAPFLTVTGSNIGATREDGEPAHATAPQGRSVWWAWTAAHDGPVTISTAGSEFDTLLGVYTGASVGSLSLVAENDDINPGKLQSRVTFQASAGAVYRIAVDGYANQIGLITLTVLPGSDGTFAPRIQQAPMDQTRFSGGGGGGTNVAFRVVATGALPLSYQWLRNGTNLPGATGDELILTNAAAMNAGTYQVAVSNVFGVTVSTAAELSVLAVPFNDDFADRIAVGGTSNVVRGTILGASKQTDEPHHGGDVGGRSVWWTWTAPADGPVEMHTSGSSFDTLLGAYTGDAVGNLFLIAGNDDMVSGTAHASRVLFNAVAGQTYQIAVDGMKNDNLSVAVVLTIAQPPSRPVIAVQPRGMSSVHVTNETFTLEVTTAGAAPLSRYQWFFNGNAIPHATNSSHALGTLSRAKIGAYSVAITNDFGGILSSNATVWVRVPQQLLPPQHLPDGRVQLRFSDPNGALSAEPDRFEIQHTLELNGPATVWFPTPGTISLSGGRFIFEEHFAESEATRIFRVLEQ